jgi:hypothetical protein
MCEDRRECGRKMEKKKETNVVERVTYLFFFFLAAMLNRLL